MDAPFSFCISINSTSFSLSLFSSLGVTDGVTDGVITGVTDGVVSGVTDGVVSGAIDGTTVGVIVGAEVSFLSLYLAFSSFGFTFILQTNFFFPAFAVILAVPFFFAVTTPFFVTVAIFFFELLHFTFPL